MERQGLFLDNSFVLDKPPLKDDGDARPSRHLKETDVARATGSVAVIFASGSVILSFVNAFVISKITLSFTSFMLLSLALAGMSVLWLALRSKMGDVESVLSDPKLPGWAFAVCASLTALSLLLELGLLDNEYKKWASFSTGPTLVCASIAIANFIYMLRAKKS